MASRRASGDRPGCPRMVETEGQKEGTCEAKVTLRGFVTRTPRLPWKERASVRLQVGQCARHGKFREYPPGLLPHKHYVVDVVEGALASRAEGHTLERFCNQWGLPEPCTPGAWIRQFEDRLVDLHGKLNRRLEALDPTFDSVQTATPNPWMYRLVWDLLARLRDVCRGFRIPFASRAYQALFA